MDHTTINHHDKITRLCLTGSGIVCGLDICLDENYGIQISSGNGITSDGRYIELSQGKTFRYCHPYEADDYPFFQNTSELWELLEEPESNAESLHPQNSEEEFNPFLRDKVVVLYLAPCATESENSSHILRFLLMEQSEVLSALNINRLATRILWESLADDDDFIYNDDYNPEDARPRIQTLNLAMNPAFRLPELHLRRLGFGKGDPFDCPPKGVDFSVFPEISSLEELYDAYVPLIDDATKDLDKALNQVFHTFGSLMDCKDMEKIQTWIDLLCVKWEAFKREHEKEQDDDGNMVSENDKLHYIQYFYDWVRDLIQGYNELRQDIIDLISDSCPNPDEFSKHLILGTVLRKDLARQPKPLRHTFRQPPIYNGNADRLQRIRLYFWRELMMIKTFYLPDYILNPKINPLIDAEIDQEELPDFSKLKITPSRFYDAPLAEQSIPFYYPLSWSRFSVHHFWNYQRTKTSTTDQLLSYHASDMEGESYTLQPHAFRPLHYRLDEYPLFRVEGHIGRALADYSMTEGDATTYYAGVRTELRFLIQKYSLPINFKVVSVSNPLTRTEDNKYEFKIKGEAEPREKYISFVTELLGAEHLAGAKEYGTLVIVEENGMVVADFFLPNLAKASCITYDTSEFEDESNADNIDKNANLSLNIEEKNMETAAEKSTSSLLDSLGTANKTEKDDLKAISGIGPKYEKQLNELGIYTYKQISKLTDKEYEILDEELGGVKGRGKRKEWAKQAKKLIKP